MHLIKALMPIRGIKILWDAGAQTALDGGVADPGDPLETRYSPRVL